jgi:hypothetical protein
MSIVQLKSGLKRREADAIAASWLKNREELQHFLSLFAEHSTTVQRKGMWILGLIHDTDSISLVPFHDLLFNIFCSSNDAAVRREIFEILLGTKDEKIQGFMLDEALQCIHNPSSSVAECHHALKWLINPSKKHPEIGHETISALSATQDLRTAAWSRYAKKKILYFRKRLDT